MVNSGSAGKFVRKAVLLLLLGLPASPVCADVQSLLQKAGERGLALHPQWRALLHYEPGSTTSSFVDDPKFFFAPSGNRDPAAELNATLRALFNSTETGNQHPRCRFPARLAWLQEQLGFRSADLPTPDCAEFTAWRARLNPDSITLVFASAYLNSPSSMYGHTLLRIDPPGQRDDSFWLSYGVNFGAYIPEGDNSIAYAWRGLAGGYPGLFAVQPYYERIQKYARLENRDLWEYRLNFTPAESGRLVDHLWELRDINFDYYFLDENCSYRLLELLDVARPGLNLAAEFPAWVIPIDTVRIVEEAGLVTDTQWRAAHATALAHQAQQLDDAEQLLAVAIAEGSVAPAAVDTQVAADARRRLVLLTAYRLLRFRQDRASRDSTVAQRSHALLRAISQLDGTSELPPQRPAAPEAGHHSARADLGFGYRDGRPQRSVSLRAAYHDLLDNRAGYRDGAAITMGRIAFSKPSGESAQLDDVEVIGIESVTPRDRFFQPVSWQVHTGWQRQYRDAESQLAPYVDAGGGMAWPLLGGTGALQATGRIEYFALRSRNLDFAPGVQLDWLRGWRPGPARLRIRLEEFSDGDERLHMSFAQQLELGPDRALRLTAGRLRSTGESSNYWNLALQHYF